MGLLSREQILAHTADFPHRDVDVPEWGGTVRVRTLTGAERDRYESEIIALRDKNRLTRMQFRGRLVAMACVDEDGRRLFSLDDAAALGQLSAKALERVFDAARDLAGLSEDDVDELTEGFGDAQSDASTSE